MQRDKGARFERELAAKLKEAGYDCRRTCQRDGRIEADVIGLPGIHIEAKHCEQMRLYEWMEQAKKDARHGDLPTVMHRKNHAKILVTMELDDWLRIYKEGSNGHQDTEKSHGGAEST